MNVPGDEQIGKLPKWAHLRELESEGGGDE